MTRLFKVFACRRSRMSVHYSLTTEVRYSAKRIHIVGSVHCARTRQKRRAIPVTDPSRTPEKFPRGSYPPQLASSWRCSRQTADVLGAAISNGCAQEVGKEETPAIPEAADRSVAHPLMLTPCLGRLYYAG
jgi:hypothetical protein